jgi:hypothetical protein
LEAATEEDKDFGFWFDLEIAAVNGSEAQREAVRAEYQRAKEMYPASYERFNEEFWAPFKPGGSHYRPGGIWTTAASNFGGKDHKMSTGMTLQARWIALQAETGWMAAGRALWSWQRRQVAATYPAGSLDP